MKIINDITFKQNCLILTNNSGGGHIEVAKQVQQEVDQKNKGQSEKIHTVTHEILTGTFGSFIGKKIANAWNNNQKKENIKLINRSLKFHRLGNAGAAIPVFFTTLRVLWKNDIDTVINVQPMATSSIVKAVRVMNFVNHRFLKKNHVINVSILLTELPTERTTDFFKSIKELSKNDRKIVKLITTQPLLVNGQNEQNFWKKNTGLSLENITYDDFPIRKAFNALDVENIQDIDHLQVKFKGNDQKKFIDECTDSKLKTAKNEGLLQLDIQKNDKVFALMLGSQASFDATLSYVKNTIEWAQESLDEDADPHYLFVFCGRHEEGQKQSLLKAISETVIEAKKNENYPPNLSIIPLAFQDDDQIAPILSRANVTITRSGGLTAMELLKVATGKVFIHVVDKQSQAQINEEGKIINEEQILKKGMLFWEGGNYLYLKEEKNAQLITPSSSKKSLANIFKQSQEA